MNSKQKKVLFLSIPCLAFWAYFAFKFIRLTQNNQDKKIQNPEVGIYVFILMLLVTLFNAARVFQGKQSIFPTPFYVIGIGILTLMSFLLSTSLPLNGIERTGSILVFLITFILILISTPHFETEDQTEASEKTETEKTEEKEDEDEEESRDESKDD